MIIYIQLNTKLHNITKQQDISKLTYHKSICNISNKRLPKNNPPFQNFYITNIKLRYNK